MCIVITCFPFDDIINIEINPSIFNKTFSYMTKKVGQKFKYFKSEKSLLKSLLHCFKRVLIDANKFELFWNAGGSRTLTASDKSKKY